MKSLWWISWRIASILIHTIAVFAYGSGLVYQFMYPYGHRVVIENSTEVNSTESGEYADQLVTNQTVINTGRDFGWKWKFLTFWDLNIQFMVYILFLVCDCLPANYLSSKAIENKLIKLVLLVRDALFHSIAFPIGWFVCSTFWILYAIDRELILPRSEDGKYPIWLNHVSHTIIGPILLLESLVTHHRIPHILFGIPLLISVALSYLIWVLYIGVAVEYWVYPILRVLTWPFRVCFLSACVIAMLFIYAIGVNIHRLVWPETRLNRFQKRWSSHEISKDHEFEDFRLMQGLIKRTY